MQWHWNEYTIDMRSFSQQVDVDIMAFTHTLPVDSCDGVINYVGLTQARPNYRHLEKQRHSKIHGVLSANIAVAV